MRNTRLSLALETGALILPEGAIAVLGPLVEDDLSALPKAQLQVIQKNWPDHEAFRRAGYTTLVEPEGQFSAALVCLPRAKAEARARIAAAIALVGPGGLVLVDGQKDEGVDSLLRDCRERVDVSDPVIKAHGKLFWFRAGAPWTDWADLSTPAVIAGGYHTAAGVFSADGIDPGSALLASTLPAKLGGKVADLGAGWGYLSQAILARDGVKALHLVEADHDALALARRNVADPRAQFHWADARIWKPAQKLETVVMNPPFHSGRTADPALGAAFIKAAGAMLVPSGVLWMVANRHLPYERVLAEAFREVEQVVSTGSFKVYRAGRPVQPDRPIYDSGPKAKPLVVRTRR